MSHMCVCLPVYLSKIKIGWKGLKLCSDSLKSPYSQYAILKLCGHNLPTAIVPVTAPYNVKQYKEDFNTLVSQNGGMGFPQAVPRKTHSIPPLLLGIYHSLLYAFETIDMILPHPYGKARMRQAQETETVVYYIIVKQIIRGRSESYVLILLNR